MGMHGRESIFYPFVGILVGAVVGAAVGAVGAAVVLVTNPPSAVILRSPKTYISIALNRKTFR